MASLGELVAGVAHEINNPLAFTLAHMTTVERTLSTLESNWQPDPALLPLWQRAHARLQEMQLGLSRIQELVLKLRIFSRLDEGERKRISVRESVESALTILQHRMGRRLTITTQFGGPDEIDCYASLLNQAIVNLISNAIDAIDGPGTITIGCGAREGWFQLVIEDTGCGIPDAARRNRTRAVHHLLHRQETRRGRRVATTRGGRHTRGSPIPDQCGCAKLETRCIRRRARTRI